MGSLGRRIRRVHRNREFKPVESCWPSASDLAAEREGPAGGNLTNLGNSMVIQNFNSPVYQGNDSITWTRGRHTLRFGGDSMFDVITAFYSGNSGSLGNIVFGPVFTASSAATGRRQIAERGSADFFLGLPRSFGRGLPSGQWIQTSNVFSGYAQDTWRVNSSLTLNLGLRYEAHTPWVERNDLQSNYNMKTGLVDYANQDNASRALYNGTYGGKDFQPRLGFAWTPAQLGGRTVFRGAFTVSSYLEGTGTNLRLPINAPFNGGAPGGGIPDAISPPAFTGHDRLAGAHCSTHTGLSCPNYSCFAGRFSGSGTRTFNRRSTTSGI